MIKAVMFDFDYTLGDSTNGIVFSVNYGLEQLGYFPKNVEDIKKTVGLSLTDTYSALTGKTDAKEADRFVKLFRKKADEVMVENTQLYYGVKEILKNLKKHGYKIAIVTTKYRYRIEQILDKFNVRNLVDLIVGGEDVKAEKPSPEGLLFAIEKLGLIKKDILYVGDSLVDAKTAANAEVSFAAVLTGTTTKNDFEPYEPDYIGQNISDIYDFIFRHSTAF